MYKVSEAAELLGVDNTKIYEQLIINRALLEPVTRKDQGVLYFESEGVRLLAKVLQVKIDAARIRRGILTDSERELLKLRQQVEILQNEVKSLDREIMELDERLLQRARILADAIKSGEGAERGF